MFWREQHCLRFTNYDLQINIPKRECKFKVESYFFAGALEFKSAKQGFNFLKPFTSQI
jgi:hypothetical protein